MAVNLDQARDFVYRNGTYIDATGQSFLDFLDGRLPALPGERPTLKDWEDHLTTAFPEVRLKRFLEMRGADGGPWARLCALPAIWAFSIMVKGLDFLRSGPACCITSLHWMLRGISPGTGPWKNASNCGKKFPGWALKPLFVAAPCVRLPWK